VCAFGLCGIYTLCGSFWCAVLMLELVARLAAGSVSRAMVSKCCLHQHALSALLVQEAVALS
jgi:hypothetical protein